MGAIKIKIIEAEERWNIETDDLQYMSEAEIHELMALEDESPHGWNHE